MQEKIRKQIKSSQVSFISKIRCLSMYTISVCCCLFLLLVSGIFGNPNTAHASATDTINTSKWTKLNSDAPTYTAGTTVGQPVNLYQVSYGAGRWLVLDESGMEQSTDGLHWNIVNTYFMPSAIAYAGDEWIAGENSGIYKSSDGVNWPTFPTQNIDTDIQSIAYSGNSYVAVGQVYSNLDDLDVYFSTDGNKWSGMPSGIANGLQKVVYGKNLFLGIDSIGKVYQAFDGISWYRNPNSTITSAVADIVYGNGTYVAVGYTGGVYTSADGMTWTKQTLPAGDANVDLYAIAYGGGKFVAVGDGGTILSSNDGVSWTTEPSPTTQPLTSIAFGSGQFIAVGHAGTIVATSNANLSNLTLKTTSGSVSTTPAFSSETTNCTAWVGNSTDTIDVTPTLADPNATLTVNGNSAASGNTISVPLQIGDNPITIDVTSQDGAANKTYTITVTRPSNNAALASLALSAGEIQPTFDPGTTQYTANVANEVTSIDVTPVTEEAHAIVKVNNNTVPSGQPAHIPLTVGDNTITISVTAQDGTAKSYTIQVTRAQSSTNTLNSLILDNGSLQPNFSVQTTNYSVEVENSVANIKVTPTVVDSTSKLYINGNLFASGSTFNEPLIVGENRITIDVVAQDGSTNTYTITVTRDAVYTPPSKAFLSNLTLNEGTLSPTFASGTTQYTATVANSVNSIDVTPAVLDSTVSIVVNGNVVDNGSATNVPLQVGDNAITIVVTAQDGTTKTYTLTVTRQSLIASSFTIENGSITTSGGIKTTVIVTPNVGTITTSPQTVIFELMNGTTPESIVALETSITAPKQVSAFFNTVGSKYSVKVFVLDSFPSDPTTIGNSLAAPVILTQ